MVRLGLDEEWKKAQVGTILKDVDTILSGENSQVVLSRDDSLNFVLGSNSILDIADLRKIQERELFLFLMTQKVDQIDAQDTSTKIRVGNVSVVHGESKKDENTHDLSESDIDWYTYEINGADTLIEHTLYPNAIIKLHQIKNRYSEEKDQGFTNFRIGRSFEAMQNNGQAMDNYQMALTLYNKYNSDVKLEPQWIKETKETIERMRSQ